MNLFLQIKRWENTPKDGVSGCSAILGRLPIVVIVIFSLSKAFILGCRKTVEQPASEENTTYVVRCPF
jgi:hypothetical protein